MKEITPNARARLKLAKSVRLVRLMTYESVQQLTACDKNLHEVLKTYMLKSCLFVLHQRLPDPTVELLPEQWALLIYEQLIEFVRAGELPMLFDVSYCQSRGTELAKVELRPYDHTCNSYIVAYKSTRTFDKC